MIFSKENQGDKIFVKIRLLQIWTRKMEKSCLDHDFLATHRCDGCVNIQFGIDKAKTPEKKEQIKSKKRSGKNICFQPWHVKHSDGHPRYRINRLVILKQYPNLNDVDVKNNNMIIDNFKRVKNKTLGKLCSKCKSPNCRKLVLLTVGFKLSNYLRCPRARPSTSFFSRSGYGSFPTNFVTDHE